MMFNMIVLVLSIVFIGLSSAQLVQNLKCDPDINLEPNFDVSKFLGKWHVVRRTERPGHPIHCSHLELVNVNDEISLHDRVVNQNFLEEVKSPAAHHEGTAKLTIDRSDPTKPKDFWILRTDYTSFAIAFACEDNGSTRNVTIWQLGRETYFPTGMIEALMNQSLFNSFGITRDHLTPVDHSETACKTLPEIPPGQNVILPGQCDENIAVFMGEWFGISSYFSANQLGVCGRAKYTLTDSGVVVENSQVVNQMLEVIKGRAVVSSTDNSAKLLVTLEIRPGIFVDSPLYVLATDYDSYAISYNCNNLPNNQKQVNAWILSRTRQLTNEAQIAVDEVINREPDLNKRFFIVDNQTDESCFYYPEPAPKTPVFFRGQCDVNIPVMKNFNATAYMGLWHNIQSYPSISQAGSCNNARYTLKDGFVDVFNTQVVGEELLSINGVARVASADGSAKLTVNFPIAGTDSVSTADYWVLDTDYESYALVYSCVNIDDTIQQVTSWKLSRTKELSAKGSTAINAIIQSIRVLDQRYFEDNDQSRKGCFYFPNAQPGVPVVFPGQCSDTDVQVVGSFNVIGFEGTWNEIQAYPKEQQPGQCVSHAFAAIATGFNLTTTSVEDQFLGSTNNIVTRTTNDGTAKFTITVRGVNGDITLPYWILDTDYTNYALAYSCMDINADFRAVYSWKLSRTKELSVTSANAINNAIQKVNVLEERYFETVDQTEAGCFHLPELSPGESVILNGQCDPNIQVVQNFNVTAYSGRWRLIESYASDFQSGTCQETTYSITSPNTIVVLNSQVVNQNLDTTSGTAVVATTEGRLLVLVTSPNAQANEYLVLDTDYTSFALVYTCVNINAQQRRVWSWKLSRTTSLSSAAIERIDPIINQIDVLNDRYFHPVDHSDNGCFYYPTPNPEAPVIFPGQCDPNIKVVTDFNIPAYMKLWHDIESYPAPFLRGTCPNAFYTWNIIGTVDVFNTEVIDQRLDTIQGVGEPAAFDGSAKLSVRFPIAGSTLYNTAPYWVLSTDYSTYALVYSCENINNEQRQVFSWKLSRTKQLTDSARAEINRVTSTIPVLRDDYYVPRNQSREGCFYFPDPQPGVPVVFPGQCDVNIQAVSSFNMTEFQGIWHEIEAYPKEQQTGHCVNHEYTLGTGNALNLISASVLDQIRDTTNSQVTFTSAQDTSGRLTITLTSGGSVINIPFWIIETDYTSYALAYSCLNIDNDYRKVFSWKLSRTQQLTSGALSAIDEAIQNIDVLQHRYFETIKQTDDACFYLPDPVPGLPVTFSGKCDESLPVVQNFDAPRYLGRWRRISSYPEPFQIGKCNEATYSLNADGSTVDVYNTQVINGELDTINGTAIIASNDGSAKLWVNFPSTPEPAPYWVLDTDYDSYALVYSCRDLPNNRRRVTSWKLSRTAQLTAAAAEKINQVVNSINVLNDRYFEIDDQSDQACFYLPPPGPSTPIFRGQCDLNIPALSNFNAAAYLGQWYDIASYNTAFQQGTCNSAYYSLGDGVVDVFNTQVVNQRLDTMTGVARVVSDDGSAKLSVTFPVAGTNEPFQIGKCNEATYSLNADGSTVDVYNTQVINGELDTINGTAIIASNDGSAKLWVNFPNTPEPAPYWVLDTDYDSYALVYSCRDLPNNRRRVTSWKLSRTAQLTAAAAEKINQVVNSINVLNDRYFEIDDQSDQACFYLPPPGPSTPIFRGQCDLNIPALSNFNAAAYLGRWRMIETYPSDFQSLISGCNEANYALGPNSVVDVYNTEVINQRLETINGTAVIDGTDGSGKLLVNFPGAPTPSEYWILDTDYDSYALVYSCLNINNQQRRVWSWKLSRTTELTSAATAKIDAIVDSINVLNKRFYMKIDHSDSSCFYYPTPDGNPVEFRGQCDQNLPVVTNFNAVEYQGLWHNIESYPTQNARGTCGNARYTLRDGVVEVFNTQVIDQKLDTISGTASLVATTDGSAKLIVRFPAGPSFTEAPYWVLDTDYRTYSLVYTCINISTERRRVSSWKLSRTKQLTAAAATAIDRVVRTVPVLDDQYYVKSDQSDEKCFYYPEPQPGVPVVFRGQCDNSIQAVANFNMTAFQGKWHEVEAYPKEQQTGQCINHEYTLGSGNALDLVSSSISEQIRDFTNSRVTFASAQETSGRLTITLNSGGSTTTIPFWVLSTDYEDHALAYSCVDLDQNSRAVYSWKLSRTQKLSSAAVIAMENKIKEINVLDNKYYENIDQSDKACFYLPDLMPGEPAEFVGQCDENLAVVQNFNAQAYEGRWRMIETYPSDFQSLQAGCLEATYTLTPGGIVQVYNTEVVNQRLDTINGTAVLASTDGSAKLLVNFPGSPEPATYWVLDTDYTSYALVYSCRNIGNQRRRVWTWKLSRTRELTENAKTKINQTVNAVDVLNEKFYISIEHSDASCFYYPIPDGNPVVFRGQCDQSIPVVMDFNAAAYMGTWYDVEGYPVQFQDGTCPSATYSLTSTGVDVYNTQVVDSWLDTIRGSAVLATSDGSAKLTVTFPIAGTNLTTSTPYWVLGTDYSNYALVYTCINNDSERHRVASWKLSRAKTLNAGSKTAIDNLISTVPVLRQDYYVLRGHTEENCFHYPNNEGGPVIQKGQCELSGINITEKFNITAFTGSWYEISRFPSEIQDGECVSSEFSIDNQKIQMRKNIVSNEEKTTLTGPATLSPDGRGIMTVTLTDPVAGVYSWKLSRSQAGLSETAVARITQIVRDTHPLFERYFENTDQTPNGCFHYPSFDDLPPTIELVGHCDTRITGKANFDVEAYLGKWNEIASYPQPFQNGECARAQYKLGSDGVDVINTQVVDKQLDVQMATAVVASDDGSGVLEVTFKFPNGVVNVVNYYIIETDYTSFALVYSCRNLTSGSRQVTSWKLSRGTTLSDEALLIIDEAINSTQGLRQDYYQPTSQTEEACFYIPEVNKNEAPLFRGQCGNISGVQGFDIQKYLGWWHEIESYPTDNSRGSCVSSEFEHINGEYHVVDTNIFNNIAQVNSSVVTVTNDGRLTKAYSNGESIDIWVLATDYETYSLLYFCQNVDSQNMRVWSAKHSKTRQLTPAAQEAMANYIVSTRALETQFYQVVDQTDSACFHYPERSGNQIIIPGQCDLNIPVVQKFDVPEYSGTWYQIERYTQVHENGTCTGARYTLDKKTGIVTVLNWQVIGDVLDTVEGTATVNSTDGSAKLIVKLPIRFTEEAEPIMVSTELYILTTDYITHSLAYSCVNVNPYRRAVGVWKLSRTRTLTEESKSAIDEYIATRKELHQPYFDTVEQNDDCDEPSSAILVKSSIIIMLVCSILQFVL
ncbi:jg19448 [Pararge aegeria aegeria]|uniref:Jg19448 protein n=1 Tax=Pararge aegeria aegeria TaxID=348720 RepID=A0A8S4S0A3_9NEOP|nr:jg19448 [Pararge aegeria aegeria]